MAKVLRGRARPALPQRPSSDPQCNPQLTPRRAGIGAGESRHRHYAANWPVLLPRAAADWPATRWTPDSLKVLVGGAPVQVQANRAADPDFEPRTAEHAAPMPFDAFIDAIQRPGAGDALYLTACNAAANRDSLAP